MDNSVNWGACYIVTHMGNLEHCDWYDLQNDVDLYIVQTVAFKSSNQIQCLCHMEKLAPPFLETKTDNKQMECLSLPTTTRKYLKLCLDN